jgi:hypothetical protein
MDGVSVWSEERSNEEKMWTKWGLNPRPHATELPSQELAKQARYHCAIRPSENMSLSKNTNVLSRHEGVTRLRHQEFAAHR